MGLNVKARYDDLGRGRGYDKKSANITYEAGRRGVDAGARRAADRLIDATRANLDGITGVDQNETDAINTYYDSLTQIDSGKVFQRRKVAKGSDIFVTLVAPVGGAVSASIVEFGRGNTPGSYPMTKALYEMGGEP